LSELLQQKLTKEQATKNSTGKTQRTATENTQRKIGNGHLKEQQRPSNLKVFSNEKEKNEINN